MVQICISMPFERDRIQVRLTEVKLPLLLKRIHVIEWRSKFSELNVHKFIVSNYAFIILWILCFAG